MNHLRIFSLIFRDVNYKVYGTSSSHFVVTIDYLDYDVLQDLLCFFKIDSIVPIHNKLKITLHEQIS